jgi:thymidylate synthase (FAD)
MENQYVEGPRIYMIARPGLDMEAVQHFLADENVVWRRTPGVKEAEEIVELGGRVCYMSFGAAQSPRTTAEYLHNLVEMGHESVLEHAVWTVMITGVSRSFSHQLVRHRAGFAFSQLSQQYHDETDAKFVLPEALKNDMRATEIWTAVMIGSKEAYKKILTNVDETLAESDPNRTPKERRRALRSVARSVLPNATETKVMVTANARALRHFLRVRGGVIGDPEMRRVAAALFELMLKEAPAIFDDFTVQICSDGSPIVVSKNAS